MRTRDEMIAYALEADVALLPHLPELLADLQELGSDAEDIADVVGNLPLPRGALIIDLGCGKGATAVEIAATLDDAEVVGVELFSPFLADCRSLADARGVAGRCRFEEGDIIERIGTLPAADVVVFAALGDVLGPLDETVRIIRKYVRPGGYMVISDVFLAEGARGDFPGFEGYAGHTETVRRLQAAGDALILELVEDADDDEDVQKEGEEEATHEGALIAARAADLVRREPDLADAVAAFVISQQAENDYIEDNLVDAIWVLQRADW